MRITVTYNQRTGDEEAQGELLTRDQIDGITAAIRACGHVVEELEASIPPDVFAERLLATGPDLVFNVAEGTDGEAREARFPAIFEVLGLPYTGGTAPLLHVCLDKRLSERVLALRGVRVPRGHLVTREAPKLPDDMPFPVIIKPNYEGSSKGITPDSIAEDRDQAEAVIDRLLREFPAGLDVEQFVKGREFTVPKLDLFPDRFLEIVEHRLPGDSDASIYDYETKHAEDEEALGVRVICPPQLSEQERLAILDLADRAERSLPCPDMGRVDVRLQDGVPYFLEVNAIPSLLDGDSMAVAAQARGLSYEDMFDLIIRSAARRHGLTSVRSPVTQTGPTHRRSARAHGITIGTLPTGRHNAITDVDGVEVGHVSHIEDDVPIPGDEANTTRVRTGITAICPQPQTLFHEHMLVGAFVLNGIGEMAGITQAQEWGWLETPILLTNTMSVGRVHDGIIQHLVRAHPELGREVEVTIPLVGETNDAFLNDVRIARNSPEDAMQAIRNSSDGPVAQGCIGGGTGMQSFDFAGGIGSSSRVVCCDQPDVPGYTVGVLVQANFGKMRHLTVDGRVVGRILDERYPQQGRRQETYGSVIVVVATDAPLLTPQLNRLAKRAALGLGRVGSQASATSGEIVMAFSTGNRISRAAKARDHRLTLTCVPDERIDPLYQAVIEATEEGVLNAMFYSAGQTGREDRYAPPIPGEIIAELLAQGEPARRRQE